jgi:biotin transport system substrate-specific component
MTTVTPTQVDTVPRLGIAIESRAGRALLVVASSLFVAASAHLSVPLPFTPVPLTFSDLAVLLVGLALGPVAGFAALSLYLLEGAAGLPVFSPYGLPGLARFAGQTGGYLLAYPFAAAIAGGLSRRFALRSTQFLVCLSACVVASAVIMMSGTTWIAVLFHVTAAKAIALGAAPFLPGQAIKIVAAAGIFAALSPRRNT